MQIKEINSQVIYDTPAFLQDVDLQYSKQINNAATAIVHHGGRLVLLAGPSASGKTTTAKLIARALEQHGIMAHVISMDHYFRPSVETAHLRNADGERDYESPECLNQPLLREHFTKLSLGEEIMLPYFDFNLRQPKPSKFKPLRLDKCEVAIYEGIHALNASLYEQCTAAAFKIYVSTQTDIYDGNEIIFDRKQLRFLRRVVRDNNFRATDLVKTTEMWRGVLLGETAYIDPFKDSADLQFDTFHAYELSVLAPFALPLFNAISDCIMIEKLQKILPVSAEMVDKLSLLREFIGGGILKY